MQRTEATSSPDGLVDIGTVLRLVRQNLGLDVAFIGEFVGERRVFRHVDAAGPSPVCEGGSDPLDESYCARIVDGRLPELIPDTGQEPRAQLLAATERLPIGSHLSVPIRLSSGMVYGTFCCFGHHPDHSLNARDLAMLRTVAGLVAQRIDRELQAHSLLSAKRRRLRELVDGGGPRIVFQPVFLVEGLRPVGVEALSRFPEDPHRSVESWFEDAAEVGCAVELEHAAIRNALEAFRPVWERHGVQLGLNASPSAILDPGFVALFADCPADRIVLELTEHEKVENYGALVAALQALRGLGMRIAVDDVGSGYAGMTRVVAVRPDIVKLDRELVRGIDTDPMREAMAMALIDFAGRCGCRVVAEGVETPGELAFLARSKVQAIQGWLLGRPMDLDGFVGMLERGAGPASLAVAV